MTIYVASASHPDFQKNQKLIVKVGFAYNDAHKRIESLSDGFRREDGSCSNSCLGLTNWAYEREFECAGCSEKTDEKIADKLEDEFTRIAEYNEYKRGWRIKQKFFHHLMGGLQFKKPPGWDNTGYVLDNTNGDTETFCIDNFDLEKFINAVERLIP